MSRKKFVIGLVVAIVLRLIWVASDAQALTANQPATDQICLTVDANGFQITSNQSIGDLAASAQAMTVSAGNGRFGAISLGGWELSKLNVNGQPAVWVTQATGGRFIPLGPNDIGFVCARHTAWAGIGDATSVRKPMIPDDKRHDKLVGYVNDACPLIQDEGGGSFKATRSIRTLSRLYETEIALLRLHGPRDLRDFDADLPDLRTEAATRCGSL